MANAEKLLRALLAKAYKKQDTEIDQLLAENTDDNQGTTTITEWDAARVSELQKPKPGTTFQDGYAKAKKEERAAFEKEIKEKFGIEADAQGIELIEAIITAKVPKGGALDDEKVKAHPVYQALEQSKKKELKALADQHQAKLQEIETAHKKDATFGTVGGKIIELRNKLNPAIPANPEVAQTLESNFLNSFREFDFDIQEGGKRIVVMKDGAVVKDEHGNSLEFDDLVKGRAGKWYEFKQNGGGSNAGNGKPGEGSGGSGSGQKEYPKGITKPQKFEEYAAIVNNTQIPIADRQIVREYWEKENPEGVRE